MIKVLGRLKMPSVLAQHRKEEGGCAIPSSQRLAVMDRGHSPNSEEVVVGTSQESGEAVGYQPTRPCEEEEEEG